MASLPPKKASGDVEGIGLDAVQAPKAGARIMRYRFKSRWSLFRDVAANENMTQWQFAPTQENSNVDETSGTRDGRAADARVAASFRENRG